MIEILLLFKCMINIICKEYQRSEPMLEYTINMKQYNILI